MIGNLNKKIFFLILLVPLLFSCGNVETDNETGRYQVIEKRSPQAESTIPGRYTDLIHPGEDRSTPFRIYVDYYEYYLLETKTGEIKKIDFEEIE